MLNRPRLVALCAFTALCCTPTASAQGKLELDKEQRIKEWGYVIRPIKGWNSIPAGTEEKLCVGRWKMNLDDLRLRGDYDGY